MSVPSHVYVYEHMENGLKGYTLNLMMSISGEERGMVVWGITNIVVFCFLFFLLYTLYY